MKINYLLGALAIPIIFALCAATEVGKPWPTHEGSVCTGEYPVRILIIFSIVSVIGFFFGLMSKEKD